MERQQVEGGKDIFNFFFFLNSLSSKRDFTVQPQLTALQGCVLGQDGFAGLNHKHPVKLSSTLCFIWSGETMNISHRASVVAGQTAHDFF